MRDALELQVAQVLNVDFAGEPLVDPIASIRRRRRQLRLQRATLALGAFAAVGGVLWAVVGNVSIDNRARPDREAELLGGPPSTVSGSGTVVAVGGVARFCPLARSALNAPIADRATPQCGVVSVRVTGVDLSALSNIHHHGDVLWGEVFLEGRLSNGTLAVTHQGRPRAVSSPSWTTPPCPAPEPGGWASGTDPSLVPLDAYRADHPGVVTAVTLFRPTRENVVVVVASTSPQQTRTTLAAAYPRQLCVQPSKYRSGDISMAMTVASRLAHRRDAGVMGFGVRADDVGQPHVFISVARVTTNLQHEFAGFPSGMIVFDSWLSESGR